MILVGYHIDPHELKEQLFILRQSVRRIKDNYENAQIIIYADLNIEHLSNKGAKFFQEMMDDGWIAIIPDRPTRRGTSN